MEAEATDDGARRRETGSFTVALSELAYRLGNGGHAVAKDRSLWASVEVLGDQQQPLERAWFPADNENAKTQSVPVATHAAGGAFAAPLAYEQSSRPVALSHEALQELAAASLVVSLYDGETRARDKDALVGVAAVALEGVLLAGQMQQTVAIEEGDASFLLDVSVRSDADLGDFLVGARLLSVHSAAIGNLPAEWTIQGCDGEDDATRLCATPERNAAVYDVAVHLPRCTEESDNASSVAVLLQSGKLQYERRAVEGSSEQTEEAPAMAGTWVIRFPDAAPAPILFLRDAVRRMEDFLAVEKRVRCKLSRANLESSITKVTDGLSCEFELDLSELLQPGVTQIAPRGRPYPLQPVDRSSVEQELTVAASNDDKKKLQAVLNDFDAAVVGQAAAVSEAARDAETFVEISMNIAGSPLVLAPPQTLSAPAKTLEELIAPRDVEEEAEQQRSAMDDLRREVRVVVAELLREYEDAFRGPDEAEGSRNDKRQALVFRLNSQGTYHTFKDALKKRIISVIRDRFSALDADDEGVDDGDGGNGQPARPSASGDCEPAAGSAQERLKERFGQLYALLMGEVHAVLRDALYADSGALEKAGEAAAGRPARAEVASVLAALLHKATESEATGDADKSETLHLDRVALVEQQLVASGGAQELVEMAKAVWLDYAGLCMRVGKLERAGANLMQSLRLGARDLPTLVALAALRCELGAFAQAEPLAANCVAEAAGQRASRAAPSAAGEAATEALVLAHALLALAYAQPGRDATGNLVRFELAQAQQALRRVGGDRGAPQHVCASAVWLSLAQFAHERALRRVAGDALRLADAALRPREALCAEQRVMQRVLAAGLAAAAGDGARAELKLREALEVDARHPLAWLALGKLRLGRDGQAATAAIECLERAMERRERLRAEDRLALYVHLGLALLHASRFAAAEAVFLESCGEFRNASGWLGVGIASLRMERWDRAQLALAMANRLDGTHPDVWGYLALLALSAPARAAAGDEQHAGRLVAQALRFQLVNPALLRELSSGLVAIDRLEQAERLLRRSLACQDSPLTRKMLADVLAAQNCAEDALRQYAHALGAAETAAERCELLDKAAQLLVTLGRPEEASDYRAMASELRTQPAL